MLTIHTDNTTIKVMSKTDMSRLYIGLLWHHRGKLQARNAIKAHVLAIKKQKKLDS